MKYKRQGEKSAALIMRCDIITEVQVLYNYHPDKLFRPPSRASSNSITQDKKLVLCNCPAGVNCQQIRGSN